MASTNKTTHYDLSQYVGSDKPTYLVDYNTDMANIDAGIWGADELARVNEQNIGNITNLDTTAKNNLVSAINEVNTNAGTNTSDINGLKTRMNNAETYIGDLTNLDTTAKSNLVSAVNEVESETNTNTANIGTLSNLNTTNKSNLVSAINEVYKYAETILYNNPTGDNGTITLSDDISNYDYLEIYYHDNDDYPYNTGKIVPNSNGNVSLFASSCSDTNIYYKSRIINCNGTTISTYNNYYGEGNTITTGYNHTNMIYITKVVGINII